MKLYVLLGVLFLSANAGLAQPKTNPFKNWYGRMSLLAKDYPTQKNGVMIQQWVVRIFADGAIMSYNTIRIKTPIMRVLKMEC